MDCYHQEMGRRILLAVLVLLAGGLACDSLPTAPSSAGSLRVQVIDDLTRQPIADPVYRLELQLTAPNNSYAQPVVKGSATFPAVAEGEYRLNTAALFGYLQVDVVTVSIEKSQTITLALAPIDDFGVEQIAVDG